MPRLNRKSRGWQNRRDDVTCVTLTPSWKSMSRVHKDVKQYLESDYITQIMSFMWHTPPPTTSPTPCPLHPRVALRQVPSDSSGLHPVPPSWLCGSVDTSSIFWFPINQTLRHLELGSVLVIVEHNTWSATPNTTKVEKHEVPQQRSFEEQQSDTCV